MKRLVTSFLIILSVVGLSSASSKYPAYNDLGVDFPVDGGMMVTASRMWTLTRFMDAGIVGGGGQIQREFDLDSTSGITYKARTKATVFPFVGPQVMLHYGWVGFALGYAVFYANTDLTVRNTPAGSLTGNTKGWGTGFYSPLLVLDFYDRKHDVIFGFGLGGFLGTSYPKLNAGPAVSRITTDASPIDTLTFHMRILWSADRTDRIRERRESLDDL